MRKAIKILLITIIFIVLAATAYLLVIYLINPQISENTLGPTPSSSQDISPNNTNTSNSPLEVISQEEELAGYWFNEEGELFLVKPNGEIINISKQQLKGVREVQTASGGARVLINNIIFDAIKQSWTPLPAGSIAAAWHPSDNNQIIYLQNNGLKIMDLSKQTSKTVMRLNLKDIQLFWIADNKVLISDKPSALYEGKVWEVDLKNKTITKVGSGMGLSLKQKGEWQLRFVDGYLYLINTNNNQSFRLSFVTLPNKCVFAVDKIYCAVPRNIDNVILPDDYLKKKFISNDDFYTISIRSSGQRITSEKIYSPSVNIDAVNLVIKENKLYFLNRHDNHLYALDLLNL